MYHLTYLTLSQVLCKSSFVSDNPFTSALAFSFCPSNISEVLPWVLNLSMTSSMDLTPAAFFICSKASA